MLDFLKRMYSENRVLKEEIKSYVPLFITVEEYQTITEEEYK